MPCLPCIRDRMRSARPRGLAALLLCAAALLLPTTATAAPKRTPQRGATAPRRAAATRRPAPPRRPGAVRRPARRPTATRRPAATRRPTPAPSRRPAAPTPKPKPPAKPAQTAAPLESPARAGSATTTASAEPLARTLIDAFEGRLEERWPGLVADRTNVKEGQTSGRWAGALKDVVNTRIPHQWNAFEEPRLDFWCHAAAGTGARFRVLLPSDNPNTRGMDGYALAISVNWAGWKRMELPLQEFTAIGTPVGPTQIDAICLTFTGGERRPDTVLCFDDLWLCEAKAPLAAVQTAAGEFSELWLQSPEFDVARWTGLRPDTEIVREGANSARWTAPSVVREGANGAPWAGLPAAPSVVGAVVPADWSAYTDLEMWVYAHHARGYVFSILAVSDNPQTNQQDDHNLAFVVDWEGWRLVRTPLARFFYFGSPVGWHKIDSVMLLNLCSIYNYAPAEVGPDAFLCLDGVRLSNQHGGLRLGPADAPADRPEAWQPVEGAPADPLLFRLPFRQTNLGERPVSFALGLGGEPEGLKLAPGAERTPALPALVPWDGRLVATVTREQLASPRRFFRTVDVATTPSRGGQAATAVPVSLEPLYYRCLELLKLPLPERLVLEDFEEGTSRWCSLVPATDVVHGGKASARWEDLGRRHSALSMHLAHDWSRYNALSFWMHSNQASGQPFHFMAFADNAETPGHDYFHRTHMKVDWTGWKEIVLPFRETGTTRGPGGWERIERFGLFSRWFTSDIKEGTVLHLDDFELVRVP